KPRAANQSIAEESARPGTERSKVGCEAIDEPCTKKSVPRRGTPSAAFLFHRKRRTLAFEVGAEGATTRLVQCSVPPVHEGVERSAIRSPLSWIKSKAARPPDNPRARHGHPL